MHMVFVSDISSKAKITLFGLFLLFFFVNPASAYLLIVNNRSIYCSSVSIVNFEHVIAGRVVSADLTNLATSVFASFLTKSKPF